MFAAEKLAVIMGDGFDLEVSAGHVGTASANEKTCYLRSRPFHWQGLVSRDVSKTLIGERF